MACIYVIKSIATGKTYTGSSKEETPATRLASHNAGNVKSTKHGRPWKIVHTERYNTYTEARKRELFLKTGRGRELLKQILS